MSRRNHYTEAMLQDIRDLYAEGKTRGDLRKGLYALVQKLGTTRQSILYEARCMGIAHPRTRWSEWEDEYIRAEAGLKSIDDIASRLGRSRASVRCRASFLQVKLNRWMGYSRSDICRLLHVGNDTAEGWKKTGILQPDVTGVYTHPAIERFLRKHLSILDLRRIDQEWLKETLTNMLKETE